MELFNPCMKVDWGGGGTLCARMEILAWFLPEGKYYSHKVCTIKNNTNLDLIFCLIKSSKIDFIFLPAFYLIMWLMTSQKNFEKIAILKI